jgi:cell wall-associated NlpC family hydrolase
VAKEGGKILKKFAAIFLALALILLFPFTAEAFSHKVTVDGLRLRSGPGTSYEVISTLYEGEELDVLEKQEGWAKVRAGDLEGWVYTEYLTCLKQLAVDAEFLRLRSEPSLDAEVIDQAPYGTILSVLEEREDWCKVLYHDQVGWMKSEFLVDPGRIDSSLLSVEETPPTAIKVVTVDSLNVRTGPGTDFEKIGTLSGGTLVTVLKEDGQWSMIEFEGGKAWVFNEYLSNTDAQSLIQALGGPEVIGNTPQTLAASSQESTSGSLVIQIAEKYLGVPYVWGGASPEEGFDCAGFVKYVFGELGISLPHGAEAISNYGVPVAFEDLRPGDVIFFQNTYRYGVSHLGIWVGNNTFIHAPEPGSVVSYEELKGFYLSHYWGARRLIP